MQILSTARVSHFSFAAAGARRKTSCMTESFPGTESSGAHPALDTLSTGELLRAINGEDRRVADAVAAALPAIGHVVDAIVPRIRRGGRVFYLGAGTSGRLGVLDASEIPPTYGVENVFVGLIAGGDRALRTSSEGSEDDEEGGWRDLQAFAPGEADSLIGLAASGRTPYVLGAIRRAREEGLFTAAVVCNAGTPVAAAADVAVELATGPEIVRGSTRMKAGTAEKMVLNMVSTAAMVKLGHVKGNWMIDMRPANRKLRERAEGMVMEAFGIPREAARARLDAAGSLRAALASAPDEN